MSAINPEDGTYDSQLYAREKNAVPPFGRAGAFGMSDGVVPGAAVVANGCVAELGWFETIADRGTAVGFVANRETLGSVVVDEAVVNLTEPDDPVAIDDAWLGEVAWRAPRT